MVIRTSAQIHFFISRFIICAPLVLIGITFDEARRRALEFSSLRWIFSLSWCRGAALYSRREINRKSREALRSRSVVSETRWWRFGGRKVPSVDPPKRIEKFLRLLNARSLYILNFLDPFFFRRMAHPYSTWALFMVRKKK